MNSKRLFRLVTAFLIGVILSMILVPLAFAGPRWPWVLWEYRPDRNVVVKHTAFYDYTDCKMAARKKNDMEESARKPNASARSLWSCWPTGERPAPGVQYPLGS